MKIKLVIGSFAAVVSLVASTAFAQIGVGVSANTAASATVAGNHAAMQARLEARSGGASSTVRAAMMASSSAARAARLQNNETNAKNRGDTEIANRIDSLNKLLSRINAMVKVSESTKSNLSTSINTLVSNLTTLKATIDADTSTTSLKTDMQSIVNAYRIYMLVIPQANIAAASDRVLTIAGELNTIAAKIQAANTANNSVAVSALADLSAKTADATTQANAAVSETASLQPDNGNKTVAAANTAALKDARTKIQTAVKDLETARKDAGTAVKAIRGSVKASATVSASTSVSTSASSTTTR